MSEGLKRSPPLRFFSPMTGYRGNAQYHEDIWESSHETKAPAPSVDDDNDDDDGDDYSVNDEFEDLFGNLMMRFCSTKEEIFSRSSSAMKARSTNSFVN